MTLQAALHNAIQELQAAQISSPKADAEWLLIHTLGATRTVLLETSRVLTPAQLLEYQNLVKRRAAREPLQWILGDTEFYGLVLTVQPGVLIPRPETEHLVELALERLPHTGRVVDVGCGSGAIGLALKHQRPNLEVWATDLNPAAVALTKHNAQQLGLALFVRHTSLLDGLEGQFCGIVANLPYLPTDDWLEPEVQLEPREALFSGTDGLDLARWLVQLAPQYLLPKGWLMLELDPRNAPVLQHEMQGWQTWLVADLTGRERFLLAQPS
jgi:release factor glutamine methyltransferase